MRNRRSFLALLLGSTAFVTVGCAATTGGSSSGLLAALDTASTVVQALLIETPLIVAAFPNILSATQAALLTNPDGSGFLDLAKQDVIALRAAVAGGISDAAGATTLEQIESYVNQALAAASPVLTAACGAVPQCSNVQEVYREIVLAAPLIEIFINNVKPASPIAKAKLLRSRASAVPSHGQPAMSSNAALALLKLRLNK